MDIRSTQPAIQSPTALPVPKSETPTPDASLVDGTSAKPDTELREAFTDFVGQTLFGSMLASMRKTVGKPAYMHGGRTEEVFQQQLDQMIVEDMTDASADSLAGPMFDLFTMQRSR